MSINLSSEKSFYRKFFYISLPIILQNILSNFAGFIDNLMIGHLGSNTISGVGIINQLYLVWFCVIGCGLIGSAGIYSAQYFGKKDYNGVKKVFQIKILFGMSAIIMGIFLFYFWHDNFILNYMKNADGNEKIDILNIANEYLLFSIPAMCIWSIKTVFSGTVNEAGYTKTTMISSMTAVISNTLLNYILIYGHFGFPELGVKGAAIATTCSRIIELVLIVILSRKFDFMKNILSNISINIDLLIKIVRMSIPLIVNEFFFSLSLVVAVQVYALQSINNIAIMEVTTAVIVFFIDIIGSTGIATEIIIGHELGKNAIQTAKLYVKKILQLTISISVILAIILYFLAYVIPNLYNISSEMKLMSTKCIQSFAIAFTLTEFNHMLFFILKAGGKSFLCMIIDSVFIWGITLPVQYFLVVYSSLELNVIYLLINLLAIIKVIIGLFLVRKGIWIKNLT